MTFVQATKSVFSKYATFSGRARRSEFWYFAVLNMIVSVLSEIVPVLGLILALVILVPGLAVTCRRLHDIGKSGWWQLISITGVGAIIMIIWCAKDSTPGVNKYGPNPKGEGNVTFTTGETKEPWDL